MKMNYDYLYPSTRRVQKISFRPGLKHALYRVSIITKLNIDDFALNEIELLKCSE